MTLRQQQSAFVKLVTALMLFAHARGYELTFGETYRSPEEARRLATLGVGVYPSYHTKKLAIDLNLFRDGVYLSTTTAHRPLGEYWESLDPQCTWGGRFGRSDGNHYSYGERSTTVLHSRRWGTANARTKRRSRSTRCFR